MVPTNPIYRIGAAMVTRIDEITLTGSSPGSLYPSASPDDWNPHIERLGPGSFASDTGTLVQSIHTWLVRTPEHIVLIDTATGNDKERPEAPVLHHLRQPFLARLAAAGVEPQDVDFVLLTHVHADHVGWNTRLRDGAWSPVFPHARHVFSAKEDAYSDALIKANTPIQRSSTLVSERWLGGPHRGSTPTAFARSSKPDWPTGSRWMGVR